MGSSGILGVVAARPCIPCAAQSRGLALLKQPERFMVYRNVLLYHLLCCSTSLLRDLAVLLSLLVLRFVPFFSVADLLCCFDTGLFEVFSVIDGQQIRAAI